ncbi:hypothetical protein F4777DRAFT_13355 [Nemania sp. FL0916]|nr:hypothetical protein F4777DRAFT_13355 [Nemania sp. FL0916]
MSPVVALPPVLPTRSERLVKKMRASNSNCSLYLSAHLHIRAHYSAFVSQTNLRVYHVPSSYASTYWNCTDFKLSSVSPGPNSTSATIHNPQVTAPEGLESSMGTVLSSVASSTLPMLPSSGPAINPRTPARTQRASSASHRASSALQRGPDPIRGSGQDRFRQLLWKGDPSQTGVLTENSPFPLRPGTIQRLPAAQYYCM